MNEKYNALTTAIWRIALAVALLSFSYFIGSFHSNYSDERTITFSSTAKETISPTIVSFNFTISYLNDKVSLAQDKVSIDTNTIYDYLRENYDLKDKQIKTTNFNTYPEYDYIIQGRNKKGMNVLKGYRVTHTTRLSFDDFEHAEEALAYVSDFGVTNLGNLDFTITEEEREEIKERLTEQAIREAKEEAYRKSKLIGIKLGKIFLYTTSGPSQPYFRGAYAQVVSESKTLSSSVPLEGGESTISVTVTLHYIVK